MRILAFSLVLSLGAISVNGCCTPYCFFKAAMNGNKPTLTPTPTTAKNSGAPVDKSPKSSKSFSQ